jgi:hypothetical protein
LNNPDRASGFPGLPELTSIGGGADEVMLIVLCKMMGTLPATDRM